MNQTAKIVLLKSEYTQDGIGQYIRTTKETSVFGYVSSVGMNEFYQAGQQGFKPDFRVTIWKNEYSNEEELRYDNVVYTVYRTYWRDDGRIELYVTQRKGNE
jgi:SPP1 family predicted phage head-tail adaptor